MIHAGGVIISNEPLRNHLPIETGSNTAVLPIIQADMADVDFYKLLKIDALGLRTLDQIKDAMDLIGLGWDWYDSEDVSDKKVFKMLRDGDTVNIFQMAGQGAIKLLHDYNVNKFEDLVAVNASNRPGPLSKNKETGLSMADMYAERKRTGDVPELDERIDWITEETYGCILFQEDCMRLGQVMAGYNLGGADSRIRKPLGKKKLSMIPEIRNEFIYGKKSIYEGMGKDKKVVGISEENSDWCIGAINNNFDEKLAKDIFDIMEEFCKYAFNKSHSVAYGLLGYKTAFLSLHHPVQWALGCLKNLDDSEKISATLQQCRRRGIEVLPPSINDSIAGFSSSKENEIRYGFIAIKNVGLSAINYILDIRKKVGKFNSFKEFYNEMHSKENINLFANNYTSSGSKKCPVDMKVETSLILSGCFDEINSNRHELYNEYIKIKKTNKELLNVASYSDVDKFKYEFDYLGDFISSNPADGLPYTDLSTCKMNTKVTTSGIVISSEIKYTKNSKQFLAAILKDKNGTLFRVNLFSKAFHKFKNQFLEGSVLTFTGKYNNIFKNISVDTSKKVSDIKESTKKYNNNIEIKEAPKVSNNFDFTLD